MAKTIPSHVDPHWNCRIRQDGLLDPRDFHSTELSVIPWDDYGVIFISHGPVYPVYASPVYPVYAKTVEEKIKLLLKTKKGIGDTKVFFVWPGRYSSDLFYINRVSIDPILKKLGYQTDEEKAKSLQNEYKELQLALNKSELAVHEAIRENNALKVRLDEWEGKILGRNQAKEDVNYDTGNYSRDFDDYLAEKENL